MQHSGNFKKVKTIDQNEIRELKQQISSLSKHQNSHLNLSKKELKSQDKVLEENKKELPSQEKVKAPIVHKRTMVRAPLSELPAKINDRPERKV